MSTTMEETKIPVKFLVDRERKKVIFAEADNNFVDTLLSFLTLPMGTIVTLLQDEKLDSRQLSIGSLSSLHEGLANLDPETFWANEYCKKLLLKPRNSAESQCHKLKVDVDTSTRKYFRCDGGYCRAHNRCRFSPFSTDKCPFCTMLKTRVICLDDSNGNKGDDKGGVFVPEATTFIITDDLHVMPNFLGCTIELLNVFGIRDMSVHEEKIFSFGSEEAIVSSEQLETYFAGIGHLKTTNSTNSNSKRMTLKLIVLKSSKKLLFCQANEDFIDFIFSFLAIPLGSVVNLLGGNTCLGCVDNLYKSVSNLTVGRDIISSDVKSMLINPQLAFPYLSKSQIFSLREEALTSQFNCYIYDHLRTPFNGTTLKMKDARFERGLVRGPALFMVTDDLVVTHLSLVSALSFLYHNNIPFCDVEELTVSIGIDEALSILKASLHTGSALSNGLNLFLRNPKEEP